MKLIASDLDGTLLNMNSKVSETNARAIQKSIDKWIKIVVVTGRSYYAANIPLVGAGITCKINTIDGTITVDVNNNILRDSPIHVSGCEKVFIDCQKGRSYTQF